MSSNVIHVFQHQDIIEVDSKTLFDKITDDIGRQGYSINPNALPPELSEALYRQLHQMSYSEFDSAGIGRQSDHMVNNFVRTDEICWIDGLSKAGQEWLAWTGELRVHLNSRLFLGLFSFESHFAHYAPGDFYKRHYDAFKGESNRVLSLVIYLNPEWQPEDSGELVLYRNEHDSEGIKVTPTFGTLVAFLSEDFPHEVLPASRDRFSIAGWYRINTSQGHKVDPPR
ncbi:2OG-Fe(II) oxygenase [Kangiella sediminilitoris]|uniref:Prolyl 4-hydroxylase subunit alpha n=1 Tax=Kangiella sediminilitoris TaxID=1144748 RepID=A0A1B3B8X2_9GAMM|nr:2OG-Fe(II) oxygenase [Kangiella sediminilitoris]AOE49249.1 prolyl 4-hydroxylase subunit alpha [Kangiella sediminilitoris]